MNLEQLGWKLNTIGKIDHRMVKAPYIRMIGYKEGTHGDAVFSYDLRFTQPNKFYMDTKVLHSLEHFMLVGFTKYLDSFISVSPMGCQTGFYLILLNECSYDVISSAFKRVLEDILASEQVPLSNEIDCGQASYHTLAEVKVLVKEILDNEKKWSEIF